MNYHDRVNQVILQPAVQIHSVCKHIELKTYYTWNENETKQNKKKT